MTLPELVSLRLQSQQITNPNFKTARQVMAHMGAMQAQDYTMAKWAIGLRTKNATEKAIDKAIDKGEILRTHVLRPTWHFVPADDIYWMLELSAPRILASMKSRHRDLGLSEALLKKSNRVIAKALAGGEHLAREELVTKLQAAKIATDENRASHRLLCAELAGIACSGASKSNKRTYALLESRAQKKKSLKREEALAKLAGIYFKSRGPATLADFTWWSGLSITEAKKALELVKKELHSEVLSDHTYWFSTALKKTPHSKTSVYLLPAFDELIISYKDRTAVIHSLHQKKAFSSNGIFWPTILLNGKITGLWKRSMNMDKVIVEPEFFEAGKHLTKPQLKKPVADFARFLNKAPELRIK